MSKKLFFLMVFVVLLAQVTGTATYGGVLFSSNWSTATGDSDNAVTDGGIWGHVHNDSVGGHTRLEVFRPTILF